MIISENLGVEPPIQWGAVRFARSPEEYGGEQPDIFGTELGATYEDVLHVPLNLFLIGMGGTVAIFGTTIKDETANTIIRVVGGVGALLGLINLIRGRGPATAEPPTKQGLDDLGQIEYWIVDPEDKVPMVKAQCPPFMVGPGLQVARMGPKGGSLVGLDDFGRLGMGFWEVLDPSGMRVAALRCRPFYMAPDLVLKQVVAGQEILRRGPGPFPGAAEFPEGTVRERRGPLFTTRRG